MVRLELATISPLFRMFLVYFNSVMVRLELNFHYVLIVMFLKFQFRYGAIGVRKRISFAFVKPDFNSVMVRLEYILMFTLSIFAIISIPLWCDWSLTNNTAISFSDFISIPLWCDWSHPFVNLSFTLPIYFNSVMVRLESVYFLPFLSIEKDISIPLWCDWSFLFRLCLFVLLRFQFRYGAIGV